MALTGWLGALAKKITMTWIAAPATQLALVNQTASIAWTALDLTAVTSATASFVYLELQLHLDGVSAGVGDYVSLNVRKNGTAPSWYPCLTLDKADVVAEGYYHKFVLCGVDTGQVLQYQLDVVGAAWDVDVTIATLGYIA